MADWRSRWRSLVTRRRERGPVLGLDAAASASDASGLDELASDDVASAPADADAGAAEGEELAPSPAASVEAVSMTDEAAPASVTADASSPAMEGAAPAAMADAADTEAAASVDAPPASEAVAEARTEEEDPSAEAPEPPAAEPVTVEPAHPELSTAELPTAEPPTAEPPTAEPPTAEPPTAELRERVLELEAALEQERARRESLERQVAGMADHDPLTGLASARRFNDRLGLAVTHARRQKHKLAIVQLGIDRFDSVRDGMGPSQGDDLLRAVALALESTLRHGDTIARLEPGPVFTVLLPGIQRDDDVTVIADKLRLALRSPFTIGGSDLLVTASIGMALFPEDGADSDSLLHSATLAMERAREKGGDAWDVHAPGSRARAAQRQARETALQRALVRGGLELYWQPVVASESGAVVGMDSLLRWRGGNRPAAPSDFVALTEVSGLAVPLGQWQLRAACRQLGAWRRQGHDGLTLGVGISARQLAHAAFVKLVRRVLDEADLPPAALELAIAAGELASAGPVALERLAELRGLGARIALDAFGAADSRIADPYRLPLDTVRIDATVVREAVASSDHAAVIRACVALARSRRLRVVAPGADTDAHRALLVKLRCERRSGRLSGGPMPVAEAERLLRGPGEPAGDAAAASGRRLL